MDDSDAHYATLLRTIATLRQHLALTALDDPQRDGLYRELLWCYRQAFAILRRRIGALRARPTIAAD
jgi:hypothetical protein